MTKKSSKGKRATKPSKRLSLSKQTLKDLDVRNRGPAGGKNKLSDPEICEAQTDACKFTRVC
jgi:hypothetical protein